jgi:hypothetical protein
MGSLGDPICTENAVVDRFHETNRFKLSDLILSPAERSEAGRLEGWPQGMDSQPSFETQREVRCSCRLAATPKVGGLAPQPDI